MKLKDIKELFRTVIDVNYSIPVELCHLDNCKSDKAYESIEEFLDDESIDELEAVKYGAIDIKCNSIEIWFWDGRE